MKMIKKTMIYFLCMSFLCIALSGCKNETDEVKSYVAKKDGEYTIYYLSNDRDKIYSYVYESDSTKTNDLISELLDELKKGDYSGSKEAVITKELADVSFTTNSKGIVTLNFSMMYHNMEGIGELLFRACIVKTICQLEYVNGVEFYIGDYPLAISDGKVITPEDLPDDDKVTIDKANIGVMNTYDFVNNIGDVGDNEQNDIVALYYADESGEKLDLSFVSITYDNTISREELVVSQLIKEPLGENCYRAINDDTVINKISTKDNICYLDLSSHFLVPPEGISLDVSVYSIVNSLVDLDTVTKVQILVDGVVMTEFAEDGMLERNFNIISEE